MELGKAYVQIVPSAQGISGSIQKAIAPEASAAGGRAGQSISQGIGNSLKSAGKSMVKAGAVATAISVPLVAGIKKSMEAYEVQNAAETKLTEIYRSRMGVTKAAAQETIKYASALQKQGVVGDEVTLSGAQQLATFAKMPSTVNSLLPAMQNLLVQQKGLNGTSQDATQIANLMGKVMMGQTGALKRVGVSFTEAEEKVLKYGTEEEKAAMLARVITNNVGDMNKAMLETPEGKIQQLKNSMGDLAEGVGAALAPALASVAQFLSANLVPKLEAAINFLQSHPVIAKIVVGITGLLAVGGPLLVMLGTVASAVGTILPIIGAISAPVLAIVGVIVAVVAGLTLLYNKSEAFRSAVQGLVSSVKSALAPLFQMMVNFIRALIPIIMNLIQTIGGALAPVINALTPILTKIIGIITKVASVVLPLLLGAFKAIIPVVGSVLGFVASVVAGILKVVSKVFGTIAKVVVKIWTDIKKAITTAVNAIRTPVTSFVNKVKSLMSFSGLAAKVKATFNRIKEAITSPIQNARDKVKGIVDKIRNFFPLSVGKIFSNLKIPHINVSGGSAPFGIGGKGSAPKISVSWYAKAMDNPYLFTGATLFGAGDAGDEVVYGRTALMNDISEAVGNRGGVTNNFYITVDGAESPEQFADRLVKRVKMEMRTV